MGLSAPVQAAVAEAADMAESLAQRLTEGEDELLALTLPAKNGSGWRMD